MKSNNSRNFVTEPTYRGRLYLQIIDKLLADRVGEVDMLIIPVSCYLEMGLPSTFGEMSDREFAVDVGDEIQIAIRDRPLAMKFSCDWDNAFLEEACRHMAEYSQRTWAAFEEVNKRFVPGDKIGEPKRLRLQGFTDSIPDVFRRFRGTDN